MANSSSSLTPSVASPASGPEASRAPEAPAPEIQAPHRPAPEKSQRPQSSAPQSPAADHAASESTRIVVPDSASMLSLLGRADEVLRAVEELVESDVHVRGNEITLTGTTGDNAYAERLFSELLAMVRAGQLLTPDHARRAAAVIDADSPRSAAEVLSMDIISRRGKTIRPKTLNQRNYIDAIDNHTFWRKGGKARG